MRQFVNSRWFALTDLFLVMVSAAAWMFLPRFGLWFSLIALLPWVLRALAGYPPFRGTPFDWLIAIFLWTAWLGYWAAYDQPGAWIKAWLLVSAGLLFYALSTQPKQNILFLSFLSFCFALTLSFYFCLTYDFAGHGGTLGAWWIDHRPHVDWPAIHLGYVSGLILINTILAFYWLWNIGQKFSGFAARLMQLLILLGTGMVGLLFLMTLSRGIMVVILGGVALWVLWKVSTLTESYGRVKALFPLLVLSYLIVLITFAYLSPESAAPTAAQSDYGTNSRAELLGRGAYFLLDYPITGAGLGSFPGLYSQYMLIIPYFYFPNSYNLFLDVAIEQGVIAGSILVLLYIGGVLFVSRTIANDLQKDLRLWRWLGLLALIVTIVHAFFYDYLYYGNGIALLFYPLGMALTGVADRSDSTLQTLSKPRKTSSFSIAIVGLLLAGMVLLALARNKIIPLWYANLGAVQMSQAELHDFPADKWVTGEVGRDLEAAEATLQSSVQYAPDNPTANYRLGLISMRRQDFQTAAAYLETAYQTAPNHRGMVKSLGYCYTWLGELDQAQKLLDQIPEAKHEMDVYIWWWETQGRPDLSQMATEMSARLARDPQ